MKIFLIGFMGSGKTTLGKLLADELKTSFIDLDERIEQDQGMSVSRIFGEKGEDFFRELEASVLRKIVSGETDFVLACGGGTPCFHQNMAYMNGQGITVWLDTPREILAERLLSAPDQRPLISGLSGEQLISFISERLEQRAQWYGQARLVIDSSNFTIKEISRKLKAYA